MTDHKDNALAVAEKASRKASPARQRTGIYTYRNTGKWPSGRAQRREQKKLAALRVQLIEQYGGAEKIRPDVAAMLESAIDALSVQRLITLHIRKAGLFRADSIKRGDLELHSVLGKSWVSYGNVCRQNLQAAAELASRKLEGTGAEALQAYLAGKDAEGAPVYEVPEASEKGPGRPQEGRTEPAPGEEKGEE